MRPEEQSKPVVRENVFIVETGWVGEEMTVTVRPNGSVYFEIDEAWQGSTETGFGARCSTELSPENVDALIAFLSSRSDKPAFRSD